MRSRDSTCIFTLRCHHNLATIHSPSGILTACIPYVQNKLHTDTPTSPFLICITRYLSHSSPSRRRTCCPRHSTLTATISIFFTTYVPIPIVLLRLLLPIFHIPQYAGLDLSALTLRHIMQYDIHSLFTVLSILSGVDRTSE